MNELQESLKRAKSAIREAEEELNLIVGLDYESDDFHSENVLYLMDEVRLILERNGREARLNT